MSIKSLYLVFLFGSCAGSQPTVNHRTGDDNNDRQVALMEQTLSELQSMNSRLQTMEGRLHALESRQKSMENRQKAIQRQAYEDDGDTACHRIDDITSKCYKMVHQKLTWSGGRAYCQSLADDADLVCVETEVEHKFLLNMIRDIPHHTCAFFYTSGRKESNGTWIWRATGRPFTYTAWAFGEPNNAHDNEDTCAFWYSPSRGVYWNDAPNYMKMCFICEIS